MTYRRALLSGHERRPSLSRKPMCDGHRTRGVLLALIRLDPAAHKRQICGPLLSVAPRGKILWCFCEFHRIHCVRVGTSP
mgnify:FL=1